MPHLQGVARDQVVMFLASLDEYITPDNLVCIIDARVDQLDLHALGFQRVTISRSVKNLTKAKRESRARRTSYLHWICRQL